MEGIYWLASYPKSGNTWFRVFLSNLLSEKNEPVDINEMELQTPIASSRAVFEEFANVESSDLTQDEIDNLRPAIFKAFAESTSEKIYCKIHDAYTRLKDGRNLIPRDCTLGAVYIIRNPLDVAVSFAFHSNTAIDKAVERLCDENFSFCNNIGRINHQLRQKLLSWSGHIESWTSHNDFPLHIIRYEDMQKQPYETFRSAVAFLGLDDKIDRINKALEFSDFKILKKQEEQSGFGERPVKVKSFFREGKIADWKNHLSGDQIQKIINHNKEIMIKFGYLTKDGNIIE